MDKQYWNNFYKDHSLREDISECSTFASFCCENFFKQSKTIVDLGCGNARDAQHFARNHLVYGLDQSVDGESYKCKQATIIKSNRTRFCL